MIYKHIKCNRCLNTIPIDDMVYVIDTTKNIYCVHCYQKYYKPYFDKVQGKYLRE